jgi:hypothetical protein
MDHPSADLLSNAVAVVRKILDVMQKAGWHISPIRRENVLARTVSFTATSLDAMIVVHRPITAYPDSTKSALRG